LSINNLVFINGDSSTAKEQTLRSTFFLLLRANPYQSSCCKSDVVADLELAGGGGNQGLFFFAFDTTDFIMLLSSKISNCEHFQISRSFLVQWIK